MVSCPLCTASKVSSRVITLVMDAMGICWSAFFSYSTVPVCWSMRQAARQGSSSAGGSAVSCTGPCGCTAVCTAGLCRRRPLPCAVPKASANSQKHTTPAHKSAKFFRSIPVPPCAMSLDEKVCGQRRIQNCAKSKSRLYFVVERDKIKMPPNSGVKVLSASAGGHAPCPYR